MPYVTGFERMAMQKGREEGRREGREEGRRQFSEIGFEVIKLVLKCKFGEAGKVFASELNALCEPLQQRQMIRAIDEANSLEEVRLRVAEFSNDL